MGTLVATGAAFDSSRASTEKAVILQNKRPAFRREGNLEIYVMNADGSGVKYLPLIQYSR